MKESIESRYSRLVSLAAERYDQIIVLYEIYPYHNRTWRGLSNFYKLHEVIHRDRAADKGIKV